MSLESLDDAESITEVIRMVALERIDFDEALTYHFQRSFCIHEPNFTLTIQDNGPNEEFTILCNETNFKQCNLEDTIENIENIEEKNLEHSTTVNIIINESSRRLRNHELESLGKEIASFIEFIFSRYTMAYILNLSYLGDGQSSSLPLFILYRVKCDSIKIFNGISIGNIMAFSLLKPIGLTNIVGGLKNLNEFILEIPSLPLENLENVQKKVNTLLRWLPNISGCFLTIITNLNFTIDQFFNNFILDIERIGLQANIKTNTNINQNFFTHLMEVKSSQLPNYIYHISDVEMSFIQLEDTKYFEKLLSVCCNLEKITLTITEEFIDNLITEGKSKEGVRTIIKDSFSYCITIKTLKSFFIDFQVAFDSNDSLKKNFVSFLFNAILSVLPDTIINLSLENITFLNDDNIKMLSIKSTSIERISFAGCQNVPQNIVTKFSKLQCICMIGEVPLNIPTSVHLILLKYPSGNVPFTNMNDLIINGDGSIVPGYRDNLYYSNLFNRLFKNSLRNVSIKGPRYLVFLDNIFKYPNYLELMNMFPLSKY